MSETPSEIRSVSDAIAKENSLLSLVQHYLSSFAFLLAEDTSGPALNILIKLMSIISLTIAPLMKNHNEDWDVWYYGLIPCGVMVIGTYLVYQLFWATAPDIEAPIESSKEVEETPAAGEKAVEAEAETEA